MSILRGALFFEGVDAMIEMQEEEHAESDFTDDHLRYILDTYGPAVKDFLLLPGPVGVQQHVNRLAAGT